MSNYTVGDFIIRIKNAAFAKRKEVLLPYSKLCKEIGNTLVKVKILDSLVEEEIEGKKVLKGKIHYEKRSPLFSTVRIVSRPSLRVYIGADDIMRISRKGVLHTVLSTSAGVMTGKEAQKKNIGGELLFEVI